MTEGTLEEDPTWVRAFRSGERSALERIFLRYADEVARQARATRLPEHEVEAVVHDVFLRAFSADARARWDGLRPYGAWLHTLTRNHLIDRHRKERRLVSTAPEQLESQQEPGHAPDARLDQAELQDVLSRFRAGLGTDEAALFRARFEEGNSLVRAAHALGWSEIRVRRMDTSLRARLLHAARVAGFLKDARVRIGTSLLVPERTKEKMRDG